MPTAGTYVLLLMAASLSCEADAQVAYRLTGSKLTTEGRLEVQYNSIWGTVCDDSFSNVEANIACASLGFWAGGEFINSIYGPGEGTIWLDDVKCDGTEQSIANCPHSPWGSTNCAHDEDVSIRCRTGISYRLAGSNITGEGRLEVLYNNTWGTVCDDSFSSVETNIACVSIGYSADGEFINSLYGPGEGPIWLDDVKCNGTEQSIGDCPHSPWGSTDCAHAEDVSIRCRTGIPYRLAGSNIAYEGRLEVLYNSTWGTVCDDSFGNVEANITCISLGYSAGGKFIKNLYGPGDGHIWLDDVKCKGTEQSITECSHSPWGTTDCAHDEDVSIHCFTSYRLAGSNIAGEGRLEVLYNNTWGTVCSHSFSSVEANITCSNLGFWAGGEFINNLYGPGKGPIWLDDVKCNGTEQSIADCSHSPWGSTDCTHDEDVSIRCFTGISYRLSASSITGEGRLEVHCNNTWGTVCDNTFSDIEANVACGSLGYKAGGTFINNKYGAGVGPIWLDDVKCNGTEQSIADCSHSPWNSSNCIHVEDVSIHCWTGLSYRLVGSNVKTEGRLQILYNNTWGTVCDDSFGYLEANIACVSLGYSNGGEFIHSLYGPGEGPIWLDDVKCSGTEQSIVDCSHSPWGSTNCVHDEDVSIRCLTGTDISYKLTGSNITGEGRLQVLYNNMWGTVCDDSFGNVEANITCISLGYPDGGEFINNQFGPGEGPIWLDDVKCNANEQSIADCSHHPWGVHDCVHDEDVSIRCKKGASILYRLAGSNSMTEGRLEVRYNNTWGTVCGDNFHSTEAVVACRSFGYPDGIYLNSWVYGPGVDPIWLDDVECNGAEQSIADCAHRPWGEHDCVHEEDIGLKCYTSAQLVYRLAGSSVTGEGRLEVKYNDTWGTVCDNSFSNVEARIACGSLGYSNGGEFVSNLYGPGEGKIWLNEVKCNGTERSIADCSHLPWGSNTCAHDKDVSIRCH